MTKNLKQVHEGCALNKDFIAMQFVLLFMAFFFHGPKVIVLAMVAVFIARMCDRLAAFFRNKTYNKTEKSSVTIALTIVLLMPANIRYGVVVAAVVIAVLVAKEAFGGHGSYPFNPAAVGYCMALVSWPQEVAKYPQPQNWMLYRPFNWQQILSIWRFENVAITEGPSYILKHKGMPSTDMLSLFLGDYLGPIGCTAALVICVCGVYLLVKKRISFAVSSTFLITFAVIIFLFPRYSELSWQTFPEDVWLRLKIVLYEMITGSTLFAAVFLVNEETTTPKFTASRIIYGISIGLAAVMFRYFGTYDVGICFAVLLVNAVSGFYERWAKQRHIQKNKGEAKA